mgnify:CR=1 FL=1
MGFKSAATNARNVASFEDRQREAGRVQRKRWAHPDDWAKIDAVIAMLNKERNKK